MRGNYFVAFLLPSKSALGKTSSLELSGRRHATLLPDKRHIDRRAHELDTVVKRGHTNGERLWSHEGADLNRTGFVGGPIPREDVAHGTTE